MNRNWVLSVIFVGLLGALYFCFWTDLEWTVERRMIMLEALTLSFGILVSLHRGRSLFSFVEYATLVTILLYQQETSLSTFYTVKLVISFASFAISQQLDKHVRDAYILYYFFPLGKFPTAHAALVFGPQDSPILYHYRNANRTRARAGDRDSLEHFSPSVLELEPEGVPCYKHALLELPVGMSPVQHDSTVLRSKLRGSGNCHNWVLHVLYNLSMVKFLSTMTLTFLRWEGWILMLTYAASAFVLQGNPRSSHIVSLLLDTGLAAVYVLDSFNLDVVTNDQRRQKAREAYRPIITEACWFGILMFCYLISLHWLRSIAHTFAGLQFILFMTTTIALLIVMKRILPPFVLPKNAREIYNEWMKHRKMETANRLQKELKQDT